MMQSSTGYGNVPASQQPRKSRKAAMIGLSSVLLVAMVVAVAVGVPRRHGDSAGPSDDSPQHVSSSVKAIQSFCQPTDYKETCVDTLSKSSGLNTTDPKELIKIAFQATMDKIHDVFNHSQVLKDAEKDPRTSKALENCEELLDYAIDDLKNSFDQIGELDVSKVGKVIEDLKIWLSGAITYQETCLDGFENTTGQAGESMRKAMNASAEMSSNALAIVNEFETILADFKVPFLSRRLLSEEEEEDEEEDAPRWVSAGKRRLMEAPVDEMKPNVVVAQDGWGDYKTITEALNAAPKKSETPFVIHVKEGVYEEYVVVGKSLTNIVMVGDGPTKTKIIGSLNFIDGTPTFKTCTVAVVGEGFIGKNLGIENTAGPEKHQAVALRVQSDMAVFYKCQFDGYQDTLYVHTHRQFYRECTISGTIDFIFGNSATVFQNCVMVLRKPLDNQQNIVTAHGRKERREPTALIIHNCTITADPVYLPFKSKNPSYLGRPWKEYARTFILQSQIDDVIHPQGWLPWFEDFALRTCFYTEFDNRGPGAIKSQRATWRGIKTIDATHAQKFTVAIFIQGNRWIKKTGIPYTPGLLPVTGPN